MKSVNKETQAQSIKSLASTYTKLANAYKSMTEKGANTTLVQKRRDAIRVGLDSLKNNWNSEGFSYEGEVIRTATDVLQNTIPSIEKQLTKAKDGSSQKTINERRLTALQLAIASLENRL